MGFLHWLSECDTPPSIHSHKLPESATLREQNDSPDPTYQDCWPSERYKSDGPDDRDQCSECRSAPGQPHAPWCDSDEAVISCSPVISCDRKDDATGCEPDLKDAVRRLYYAAHWTPDRDVDERQLWEDVRDAAGFEPGHAPGCEKTAQVTDSVINVESCPECGSVTDLDYGPESVLLPKRESGAEEETFDVPFPVQEFIFEELAEVQAEYLHDILKDHTPLIVEMARDRFRKGYAKYGSAAYQWDAETRLTNVLEELADSVVYLTTGSVEC